MPLNALGGDDETAIGSQTAEVHTGQAIETRGIQHGGWTTHLTAQMQPVQRRSAACFKVRLVPHTFQSQDVASKASLVANTGFGCGRISLL